MSLQDLVRKGTTSRKEIFYLTTFDEILLTSPYLRSLLFNLRTLKVRFSSLKPNNFKRSIRYGKDIGINETTPLRRKP